eukprot:9493279-Pyramimonas_sp.AAC.1
MMLSGTGTSGASSVAGPGMRCGVCVVASTRVACWRTSAQLCPASWSRRAASFSSMSSAW